ncbi:hypothetical protein Taro_001795 [Colocasia esculenta]|uniref:Uncharacterized protein n=1 Tax=Colocasia esculenta TaxID=4460 RepID=A0A843TH99_COLES|nr:hypothetical protein [Colocasia esculenta]
MQRTRRVGQSRLPEHDASAGRVQKATGGSVTISPEKATYRAVAFSGPASESEQEKDRPWIAVQTFPVLTQDCVTYTSIPEEDIAMASRGRRGAHTRDDEQRHEDRGEQQAPAPQGLTVLPPPPPIDYGVFMQGLVQAMQTQAHTQATLQAQLEAQAQAPTPVPQEHGHGGPSIMERFKSSNDINHALIYKHLASVDRYIQSSKMMFCLQPSVDRSFLAVDRSRGVGYNQLVDHVGTHGQRRLTEALNKDSLVRQKEYLTESSSESRESVYIETSARRSIGILEQRSVDNGVTGTSIPEEDIVRSDSEHEE